MGMINQLWIPTMAASTVLVIVLLCYAYEHMFGLLSRLTGRTRQRSALEGVGEEEDNLPPLRKSKRKKKRAKKLKQAVAIDFDRSTLHPVELSWEDVACTVATGDAKGIKIVLQKSKGTFLPGEFVAIVGPSGAGKSTMLDVLAGRKTGKGVEGIITLNGHRMNRELANRCISYVGQEDVFMPNLSAWESLLFVSQLCMEPLPRAERAARMDAVLDQMGLLKVKKTKVGGALPGGLAVRGLSGGEQRRLSIACGLMGNPSILFLDEPTTGLDSHAALAVMTYLSTLAARGHTVVSTIHQPRQEIFSAFDKILVLSEGYQLYLAPPSYVTRWFVEVLGYPYNKNRDGTESDWLLSTVAVGFEKSAEERSRSMSTLEEVKAASDRFDNFVGHLRGTSDAGSSYAASDVSGTSYQDQYSNGTSGPSRDTHMPRRGSGGSVFSGTSYASKGLAIGQVESLAESPAEYAENGDLATEMGSLYARSWFVQCAVLWKRSFLYQLRNPVVAANRLMFAVIGGTVVGLCWLRIPDESSSAQQRLSLLFWAIMQFCMIPFAWQAFPLAEKRFFTLDSAKDLYCPSAYFAAYILSNVPLMILTGYTTMLITYGLVGFRPAGWAMIQMGAIISLHQILSNQLITACIWLFSSQDMAASVASLYISFSLLICGYYIRVSDMTLSVARAVSWASYSKYTFQALAVTELGGNRTWSSNTCPTSTVPGFAQTQPLCALTSQDLLDYYDYKLEIGQSIGAMLGFWGLFCLMGYWGLLRLYAKR